MHSRLIDVSAYVFIHLSNDVCDSFGVGSDWEGNSGDIMLVRTPRYAVMCPTDAACAGAKGYVSVHSIG